MARRRSRKTAKISPVNRVFNFQMLPNSQQFLDSAFVLSYMNRKAFRQGYEYVIEKIEVLGNSGVDAMLTIDRLSPGWVPANSWVKAFSHWKEQQDDWLDESGTPSLKGRYNDFKVFMNSLHVANPVPMLPTNAIDLATAKAVDPTVETDWEYSQVVVPNDGVVGTTNEYLLKMVGADQPIGAGDCKGMIHNYALSRSRPFPTDPNSVLPTTDGGLYQDMVDVGDNLEEVGENVRSNNDQTPYLTALQSTAEWYPGGGNNPLPGITTFDTLFVRGGPSAFSTDQSTAFSAYCGLVALSHTGDGSINVRVTFAPGDYKGVMARPMQDVN